jgi:hypothetical protein
MRRRTVGLLVTGVVALGFAFAAPDAMAQGRYKKDGNKCEWDARDSGPNQCTPAVKGRFKKDGNTCRWDANDNGPDQCDPRAPK